MISEKNRVHIDDKKAGKTLYSIIHKQILKLKYHQGMELIILCIGTDRSTGDSLGPLTGTMLEKIDYFPAHILGNINNPVHANNLKTIITKINNKFKNPFIIAIDAGLGKQSSVGCIDVKKGPLKPGTGVNKKLKEVGNMHITGLVNVSGYMEYLVLQSTRLSLVMKMAKIITRGLKSSILSLTTEKSIAD